MANNYLTYQLGGQSQDSFNALGKAREDVITTLESNGWRELQIKGNKISRIVPKKFSSQVWKFSMMADAWLKSCRLSDGDRIIYQYPDYQCIDKYIIPFFSKKDVRVEVLIHDLDYMRSDWHTWEYESRILDYCDIIYVHNDSMLNLLESKGIPRNKMKTITLFDYYSSDTMNQCGVDERMMKEIAFAGNLSKSLFIHELHRVTDSSNIRFKLYGLPVSSLALSKGIEYAGKFSPEHTGYISAGWGLVWDGDSIETCSGKYGQYLTFNSSHKLSLYLACGIPVIVWSGSAMAEWVESNKLGITVDSLLELSSRINGVSIKDYNIFSLNAVTIGNELRQGRFLSNAIANKTINSIKK